MNYTIPPIKDIVKNNTVHFWKYKAGFFYYTVGFLAQEESGDINLKVHSFHVPIEDIGDATMLSKDKALIFMRYIRKAIEGGTFIPFQE